RRGRRACQRLRGWGGRALSLARGRGRVRDREALWPSLRADRALLGRAAGSRGARTAPLPRRSGASIRAPRVRRSGGRARHRLLRRPVCRARDLRRGARAIDLPQVRLGVGEMRRVPLESLLASSAEIGALVELLETGGVAAVPTE